jgi:hypothetical protein
MTRKGRLRLQRRKRQVGSDTESEENSESNSEMSGTEGKLDRIEEEDEVASNTAEAEAVVNLAEVAEVESNLPAEDDNTIKVEETGARQDPVDPVDEAVYLLDLFADENAKYLDAIINRRKGQNVR